MKKLFSLLIVFISIKCFGQVYQVLPQYGYEMKRVNPTLVLQLPSDTTNNKTGVARIGTVLYIGNGTKWTASTVTDATKLNISDTASMLTPYAKTIVVNTKVNISDTAAMLNNYAKTSAVNLKVNIADTSAMLTNYAKTSVVNSGLALKVNIADTAAMLTNYAKTSAVNLKVNISDTASMLTPYLRKIDTASLSNRINLKADINSPTFTGTVGGITQSMVGLGNVTNESKATMFTNATFTGTFATAAGAIGNASLANGAVANLSGTNTGDQTTITGNAATATALQTARTIGTTTGDATSAGSTFDGTANNTNALTLATVNSNVGSFGSATQSPTYTVNGKGLLTAAANVTITPAVGSISGLGTGVATALGVNTGSAGAVVLYNGDAGTPSALIGTNITGTASLNINGTVGATTATTGAFTTATASTSLRTPLLIGGTATTSPLTYKTTTGVGATGADHIFQVGNNGATEAMRILNSGLVGIGTTTPSTALEIGNGTGTKQLYINSSNNLVLGVSGGSVFGFPSGDITLMFTSSNKPLGIANQSANPLIFGTNALERMRIDANGNLGIGTATPAASSILDVTSTTKGFLLPRMTTTQRDAISSPATGLSIFNTTLNTNDTYDGTQWQRFGASTSITGTAAISTSLTTPLLIGGTTTTSPLTYKTTTGVGTTGADHIFKVGNNGATEAMRILNSGNVGIGTASPAYKLDVSGVIYGLNQIIANSTITDPTTNNTLSNGTVFSLNGVSTNNNYGIGMGAIRNSKYDMWFQTGSSNGGGYRWYIGTSEKMTINEVGSLGIGTTTPASPAILDVTSTTKGILFPRMTTTQKNNITGPTAGLVVYDTTLNKLCVYTTAWETITSL